MKKKVTREQVLDSIIKLINAYREDVVEEEASLGRLHIGVQTLMWMYDWLCEEYSHVHMERPLEEELRSLTKSDTIGKLADIAMAHIRGKGEYEDGDQEMTTRAALEKLCSAVDKVLGKTPDGQWGIWSDCTEIAKALSAAKRVLSKAPKNLDRVNSSDEAVETYCRETGWAGDVYQDVLAWLFSRQEKGNPKRSTAKRVEPPDDTVVWVVYNAGEGRGINGGSLVAYKEKTWIGTVPFDAGPRLVAIELYDDHTAVGETGRNYIQPMAWFYTEEEADAYIKEHT